MIFYCIASLQEDNREQKKVPRDPDIHTSIHLIFSTYSSIIFGISSTPLYLFFQNCVFYRRLCFFNKMLL